MALKRARRAEARTPAKTSRTVRSPADDENWRKHTLAWVNDEGDVKLDYRPVVLDPLTTFDEGGIDPKKIAPKARVY